MQGDDHSRETGAGAGHPSPRSLFRFGLGLLITPAGTSGAWRSETGAGGVAARYLAPSGRLLGFALTGAESGRKKEMLNAIQAS